MKEVPPSHSGNRSPTPSPAPCTSACQCRGGRLCTHPSPCERSRGSWPRSGSLLRLSRRVSLAASLATSPHRPSARPDRTSPDHPHQPTARAAQRNGSRPPGVGVTRSGALRMTPSPSQISDSLAGAGRIGCSTHGRPSTRLHRARSCVSCRGDE